MSRNPAEDALNELLPYFEAIDTRNAAIVQLLKDKGIASDQQLAPYLEQAAKASNVKWLAARLRMGRLFSVPETKGEAAWEKPEQGQLRTTQSTTEERITQPGTDGDQPLDERKQGETVKQKSEENTDLSRSNAADNVEPSDRTTKSSSSEHAGSEKNAKSAPEKDSNKDAA